MPHYLLQGNIAKLTHKQIYIENSHRYANQFGAQGFILLYCSGVRPAAFVHEVLD